jgi:DNA-binding HxlR family transcriptional regulator
MALLDLLGRRWMLRILWELRSEAMGFRILQERCDSMSPSVLSQRLTELQEAGIVIRYSSGDYRLTNEGRELLQALAPLQDWACSWAIRENAATGENADPHS